MSQKKNIQSMATVLQNAQDARCKEMTRICRKAEKIHFQTRMIEESEEQKLHLDLQRVYKI